MLPLVVKAYDRLIVGLAALAGFSILAMFVIVVADVTLRSSGMRPPRWSVPVTEYLLVYFTMAAAPYLVRRRRHVFVEFLVQQFHPDVQRVFGRIVALFCAAVALVATYFTAQLVHESVLSGEIDLRAIDIPIWLLYAPMPVGFFLTSVEFAIAALSRGGLYSEEAAEA